MDYEQSPPAGGAHNPVWQNCGYYDRPVRDENAVHSLEHGAVWITYSPDLPRDQVADLQSMAEGRSYILVSPYPDLGSPVVASAWGKQVALDGADDPDLESFIGAYRLGPQTPEPGAVCTGGTGDDAVERKHRRCCVTLRLGQPGLRSARRRLFASARVLDSTSRTRSRLRRRPAAVVAGRRPFRCTRKAVEYGIPLPVPDNGSANGMGFTNFFPPPC